MAATIVKPEYPYSDITGRIIGCAIEVHSIIGNGFQEVIYQRALAKEFAACGLAFQREFEMPIYYKGDVIGTRRVDFLVEEIISVELKAVIQMDHGHLAQAINYLEVYNLEVGLLLNFGTPRLEYRRLVNKKFDRTKQRNKTHKRPHKASS